MSINKIFTAYMSLKTFQNYVLLTGLGDNNLFQVLLDEYPNTYNILRELRNVLDYNTFQFLKSKLDQFDEIENTSDADILMKQMLNQLLSLCKERFRSIDKPYMPKMLKSGTYFLIDADIINKLEDDDLYNLIGIYNVENGTPAKINEFVPHIKSGRIGLFEIYSDETFNKFKLCDGIQFVIMNDYTPIVLKSTSTKVNINIGEHINIVINTI